MADEEKEKAEKLAAAKKRFEQLKKEQQKKGRKGATKKKDDATTDVKNDSAAEEAGAVETPQPAEDGDQSSQSAPNESVSNGTDKPARQPSISTQSRERSESFRQGNAVPSSPAASDVQDLYRKQAARIEELEKENETLKEQQENSASRLAKADEELESFWAGGSDLAELKSKTQDMEKLQAELATTQRQLAQAQSAAKGANRRASGPGPEAAEQLASKTSAIESLELELSTIRNQLVGLQTSLSERDASAKELEDRAIAAETATASAKQELDALKVSISIPSDETQAANEDPEALTKRITVLESDLRTANTSLDAAAKRATSLEQKIEALTKLHRDAATISQAKDKELVDLRAQVRRRDRPSHVRDASEFELGEEETETGALQARIRALEAENFDLKRNVWRERRAELQPGIDEEGVPSSEMYEDVDLASPYGTGSARKNSAPRQNHSTFQDVITSGISAFTGRPREPLRGSSYGNSPARARKQSLGLLSEDGDDFDPDAFRLAQEEEAKRRIERIKEVKRGLDKWKGWRMDLSEMRQNGIGGGRECGPVFEV